ncbi:hypothetical protein X797_003140 [Metarhizium robertsii]|uniref:Uncharacterized protein n=1 Tax=Metarhizium robertsii TaxID=568076 RepID=A0A0A1V0H6_9HYPO|nr:hypothetical protein X797_003140 [Metarhizium robertsii]
MPATQQQMTQEPAPAVVPESRTSTEQPSTLQRPVEPMSADSMRLRGGGEEGEYEWVNADPETGHLLRHLRRPLLLRVLRMLLLKIDFGSMFRYQDAS